MEMEIDDLVSVNKKTKFSEEVMEIENFNYVTGSTSASVNSEKLNDSNSDTSYQDDKNKGDQNDKDDASDCDMSDYADNDNEDYYYDDDDDSYYDNNDDAEYLSIQAQFDNVDLPTGVEASVSWMKDTASTSNSNVVSSQGDVSKISSGVTEDAMICVESSTSGKKKEKDGDKVMRNYKSFKHFDFVDDHSDHHYSNSGFQEHQPSKQWTKKIQDEWKILEKDLPDTIYVRVYESRMDLLRAIIVGPQETPYHDGLFVFDVLYPPSFPAVPPMVYYYSGGLRLNPNLYACGKVCLSLLNTWTGHGNEKWVPKLSTTLQVLVSIQALILNAKPFFNEPGHEDIGEQAGELRAKAYNEDTLVLSLKTMMYTLRRPPKHFEDLVTGHFRSHAHDILSACMAYTDGALVGSLVHGKVPDGATEAKSGSTQFKAAVGKMINGLIMNFKRFGVLDSDDQISSK